MNKEELQSKLISLQKLRIQTLETMAQALANQIDGIVLDAEEQTKLKNRDLQIRKDIIDTENILKSM